MSRCSKCAHFLRGGTNGSSRPPSDVVRSDAVGLCRRYPPVWTPAEPDELEGSFNFPAIHMDHRCGEWTGIGPWEENPLC